MRILKKAILYGSFFAICFSVVTSPQFVHAQIRGVDAESVLSGYTLLAAIVIGFLASVVTIMYAFQMRGSVLGDILNAFSLGMLLIILGFLSSAIIWTNFETQKLAHDALFISGYIAMLLGASRMRKLKV